MNNILIVEDEFLIAMEMEAVLLDLGHNCAGIAHDMETAMAKAAPDIDVALVDVNLADGATGPIIGEKLANDFQIKVVFVTANPAQLGDGINGTLGAVEKPVDLSILKDLLGYVIAVEHGEEAKPPKNLHLFNEG